MNRQAARSETEGQTRDVREAATMRALPWLALAITAIIGLGYWFDVTANNGMFRTTYIAFGWALLILWVLIGVYRLSFGKSVK